MAMEIRVPQMGESVTEGSVARWLKKPGEFVKQDELLVEIETDKVTVEVNAPASGVLTEIKADSGANVEIGAVLGVIDEKATAGGQNSASVPKAEEKSQAKPAVANEKVVMPSAQKIAADAGVSAAALSGTGKDGRVLKEDVLNAITSGGTISVSAPAAPEQKEERVKMTRLRQTVARRLKEAQNTAAMLTTFNEIDMTAVMNLRNETKDYFEKKHGVKLGFMSFFVKSVVQALKEIPAVNAEIDGDEIIYKNYYHIGVAVGTPTGLVVPVVRNCENLSFSEIEKQITDYGKSARDGKLSLAQMQGGTFTISNGGVYGSLMSTPIINPPQSGILGMHKIQQRPIVLPCGKIEARPMMYLALSYDHRIIDGKEAVTFLVRIKESLEDPRRLLLDI